MTDVKSSSLIRSSRPSLVMPAFDTSTSTVPPNSASTASKAASTSVDDVTSHLTREEPVRWGSGVVRDGDPVAAARRTVARVASPMPREPAGDEHDPRPASVRRSRARRSRCCSLAFDDQRMIALAAVIPAPKPTNRTRSPSLDAAGVERVGERQRHRRRRRVAGAVEHDGRALQLDSRGGRSPRR